MHTRFERIKVIRSSKPEVLGLAHFWVGAVARKSSCRTFGCACSAKFVQSAQPRNRTPPISTSGRLPSVARVRLKRSSVLSKFIPLLPVGGSWMRGQLRGSERHGGLLIAEPGGGGLRVGARLCGDELQAEGSGELGLQPARCTCCYAALQHRLRQ